MKHLLAVLLALLCASPLSRGADDYNDWYVKAPILSAEEQARVLISISFDTPHGNRTFYYRLYNGLKDKAVIGFVFAVFPKGTEEKDATQEIFVPTNVPPLQTSDGAGQFFLTFQQSAQATIFQYAVKEIRYRAVGAKP